MIYCTNCGQQNADDARTCMNCGQAFTGQGSSTPFTTPPPAPQAQQQQQGQTPWGTPAHGAPMQPRPGGGLTAVGEKRDPVMVIVYGLLTCGIYLYFWIHQTSTDIKNALGGREDINPTMDVVLTICTCGLYFIYLCYRYPQLLLELQDKAAQPRNDISTISIVLALCGVGIVSLFMIQTELNKVWESAGRR
jgi:hypothetical protein